MLAVIDIETTGLNRFEDKVTYFGVLLENGKYSIKQNPDKAYVTRIFQYLRKNKCRLVYQNGKFDTLFLEYHFGVMFPVHEDIMLMGTAYDLAETHGLKDMAKRYLGVPNWDIPKKEKLAGGKSVKPYLKKDLIYTMELYKFFREHMDRTQKRAYLKLLKPAYLMYRKTEKNGIYLDKEGLKKVKLQYKKGQADALAVLRKRHKINWNSPKQVQEALFVDEHMPILKRTDSGSPSADVSVLKKLAAQGFETASNLLEYKFYYGANTKFLNRWGKDAAYDGRIHPSFNLTNVVTGRTSCSDPNLQQVPRRAELRRLFTAPEGRILLEADYSQIELRVAADYANEPTMIDIYRKGGDIHAETAKSVTGKKEITKDDRTKAKPVNFGFLYGMGAKGFVNYALDSYGVVFTLQEAEQWREVFFAKYSRLLEWHKEMEHLCEAQGGVENRFGRFRKLPDIYSPDFMLRSAAARRAINSPVQGTASDLLLLAAVEIADTLKDDGTIIVGTVHDSILIECDVAKQEHTIAEVKRIMSSPAALKAFGVSFSLPIEADVGAGAWGSK